MRATEPALNSFVLITENLAREQAAASTKRYEKGKPLGPMDGVPIGLKDIFDTKNIVTACGCYAYRGRIPKEDAHSVTLLQESLSLHGFLLEENALSEVKKKQHSR